MVKSNAEKFALIVLGKEESLGIMFVGGELKENGYEFRYFDGEQADVVERIVNYKPSHICFSPFATDEKRTLEICQSVKAIMPQVVSVFGGINIMSKTAEPGGIESFMENACVDVTVIGPSRGAIEGILSSKSKALIKTCPTTPDNMAFPARREFYQDIPRLASRYIKSIISMFGCPFNCSFCSNGRAIGDDKHRAYRSGWWLR